MNLYGMKKKELKGKIKELEKEVEKLELEVKKLETPECIDCGIEIDTCRCWKCDAVWQY